LQVTLCDPYLSALSVRYYKSTSFTFYLNFTHRHCMTAKSTLDASIALQKLSIKFL